MIKIIKKRDEIKVKNLVVTIYGQPGTGKTTLGGTAQDALLLDFDNGTHRALFRPDCIQINDWSEVGAITQQELQPYKTVVVDTVGKMMTSIILDIAKTDPKMAKKNGDLQIAGYGELKKRFSLFVDRLRSYGKNIVFIGHNEEEKMGEVTKMRIKAPKSGKDYINECSDLYGYMYIDGNGKRCLTFDPSEINTGKNSAQLPLQVIPNEKEAISFLGDLIDTAINTINERNKANGEEQAAYDGVIDLIDLADNEASINALLTHEYLLANPELKALLVAKTKKLDMVFNKETKQFAFKAPVAPHEAENVGEAGKNPESQPAA